MIKWPIEGQLSGCRRALLSARNAGTQAKLAKFGSTVPHSWRRHGSTEASAGGGSRQPSWRSPACSRRPPPLRGRQPPQPQRPSRCSIGRPALIPGRAGSTAPPHGCRWTTATHRARLSSSPWSAIRRPTRPTGSARSSSTPVARVARARCSCPRGLSSSPPRCARASTLAAGTRAGSGPAPRCSASPLRTKSSSFSPSFPEGSR
jgi:hypothetical protein